METSGEPGRGVMDFFARAGYKLSLFSDRALRRRLWEAVLPRSRIAQHVLWRRPGLRRLCIEHTAHQPEDDLVQQAAVPGIELGILGDLEPHLKALRRGLAGFPDR